MRFRSLPNETARTMLPELLQLCQRKGIVSYLGVFKRHRPDEYLLSHGLDGWSLALDFPIRAGKRDALVALTREMTARVLDAAGIQTVVADEAGCCGAIRTHLNDREGGLKDMRRNIDAWWPQVDAGEVEAIVMNASGCGVTVKEYGHILQHDPLYADKARRISALTQDLSELLPDIAADAHISLPLAGTLITAFALAYAIGAPVLALQTRASPTCGSNRRTLSSTVIESNSASVWKTKPNAACASPPRSTGTASWRRRARRARSSSD